MNTTLLMSRRMQLAEVGRYAFPWLLEMASRAKSECVWPVSLTDYYTSRDDIETAAVLELLLADGAERNNAVMALVNLLGEHPFDVVKERRFIFFDSESLSVIPFVLDRYKVMQLMEWLYDVRVRRSESLEYAVLMEMRGTPVTDVTLSDIVMKDNALVWRLQMMAARMTLSDGFGKGLWSSVRSDELTCPCSPDVVSVLRCFYPLEKVTGDNINEILEYIGFDCPVDFCYAVWGIGRMNEVTGGAADIYMSRFRNHARAGHLIRFCTGTDHYTGILRREVPDIIL